MFDLVQVMEDFVDAANPFFAARLLDVAKHGSVRPDRDPVLQHRRPEDLKASVIGILPEQDDWTIEQLCKRLGLVWNKPNQLSLGLILKELGWKSRVVSIKRIRHWRKSFKNFAPVNRFSARDTERVAKLIQTKNRWTTELVCEMLSLDDTHHNRQAVGYVFRSLGWTRRGRAGYYMHD